MSVKTAADAPARPGPGVARRWWLRRLVPLVTVGVVASTAQLTVAGLALHEAADRVRHVAAGAGATGGEPTLDQQREQSVTKALATMTAALRSGDAAAYTSVADPADAALRGRLSRGFAAMRRVPLGEVSYVWPGSRWSRPAGVAQKYRDPEAVVALVQRRSRLTGWDRGATAETLALTFARRDGRWVLAGDSDGAAVLPGRATPEPWSVGDVSVLTRPHVLVVGDRLSGGDAADSQRELRRLADRVEDAVGPVRGLWTGSGAGRGTGWNGKVVVYAVTSRSFVNAWFGDHAADGADSAGDPAEFDAEVVPIPAAGGTTAGQPPGAMRLVTPAVLGYDTADARALIRHELTHVATLGSAQALAWLVEGIAEYTAFRSGSRVDGVAQLDRRGLPKDVWSALRRSSYEPELVADHDAFYDGTSGAVSKRYSDGWLAALRIADRYGEPTLRKFVATASDPALPSVQAREDAAFKNVLHTSKAKFRDDVGDYARRIRRSFQ